MEFNVDNGFIKLYRDWFEVWEFNKNPLTTYFFVYCLLSANYRPNYGNGVQYEAGQFIRTERQMAEECGLSRDKIRRIMNDLINAGLITREEKGKSYLYTINDYKNIVGLNKDQKSTKDTSYWPKYRPKTHLNKNIKEVEEVGEKSPTTYSTDFLKFWKVYTKKGKYKKDTYEYWKEQSYDEEVIKDIIYGAECYCKEFENDKLGMVYPRTFLENEMWEGYPRAKQRTEEEYQEDIKRAIGVL